MPDSDALASVAESLSVNLANSNDFLAENSQHIPYNGRDFVSGPIRSFGDCCAARRLRLVRLCPSWTRPIGFVITLFRRSRVNEAEQPRRFALERRAGDRARLRSPRA